MRVFPLVSSLAAVLLIGCGANDPQPDHQAEWRDVLRHKQAAVAADASAKHKQVYADSLRAFVQKHPGHSRAREVWQRMELQFAGDLAALGRYQDALRLYGSVLANDPDNEDARKGFALATDRLAVTHEKLLALAKGMSQRQVASLLGRPVPGWSVRSDRADSTIDAWYYRTRAGTVAAVYFRDGKVFAAEESSNARLGRLGS